MMKTIFYILLFFFLNMSSYSQWQIDGVAISDTIGQQVVGGVVSDGKGGAFIVWHDNRSDWDIYSQHVDGEGNFYWEKQGRPIVQISGIQSSPKVISDGEGGFVAVWHDTRNNLLPDVYAQRINWDGLTMWELNGVPVTVDSGWQAGPKIIPSSDGNFIISWYNEVNSEVTFKAQKISLEGAMLWQSTGVTVSDNKSSYRQYMAPDQQGGCVLAWASRDGSRQLYAQRLDSNGNRLWGNDGVVASTNFAHWSNSEISICTDSTNGAIIAWHYTQNNNAYIQRVDSSGNRLWGDTGIQLGNIGVDQRQIKASLLNRNRVICIWHDFPYLYIQKFNLQGTPLFPLPGLQINNYRASLELDMIINFQKEILITNTKIVSPQPRDTVHVYSHKVDSSGQILWDSSGVPICQRPFDPFDVVRPLLTTDMEGGAIISWIDYRKHTADVDCYTQRVYADGSVGGDTTTNIVTDDIEIPQAVIHLDSAYPNPFNDRLTLSFTLNQFRMVLIDIYNIQGQKINTLANHGFPMGKHLINWNGTNQTGKEVSSGIYFIVLQGQGIKVTRKVLFLK